MSFFFPLCYPSLCILRLATRLSLLPPLQSFSISLHDVFSLSNVPFMIERLVGWRPLDGTQTLPFSSLIGSLLFMDRDTKGNVGDMTGMLCLPLGVCQSMSTHALRTFFMWHCAMCAKFKVHKHEQPGHKRNIPFKVVA